MLIAIAAAHNSSYRYRLGATIVSGGRVMGVGWSKTRNRPANVSDEHLDRCSVHAEIDALRGISNLRRATCYVARIGAKGKTALSKPCDSCWQTLAASGVTFVYWTTDTNDIAGVRLV